MVNKKVSIIIVNWNGKHFLKPCLESIKKNTKYENYEIVVVDNGSNDGSIEFLEKNFSYVKIIKNKTNLGFARANNKAIKKSRSEYLYFLNNDTEVNEGWISEAVKIAEKSGDIGIVGSKVYYMNMRPQYMAGRRIHQKGWKSSFIVKKLIEKWANSHDNIQKTKSINGAAFLVKKKIFDTIGLFDERFFVYGEEGDFCYRARGEDFIIMYTPFSKIKHLKSGTSKKMSDFSYYHRIKNDQRFRMLNFSLLVIFFHIVFSIPLSILNSIKNNRFSILIKAYKENWKNLDEIKEKRKTRKKWFI